MQILVALFLDTLLGDPKFMPHPVAGVGAMIRFWEGRFYPGPDKRQGGRFLCLAVLLTTVVIVGLILLCASLNRWLYELTTLYLLYTALAWRSLKDHTLPVVLALSRGDLETARGALSLIVGRDTENLNEKDVTRAAVETLGENFIDGIFSVLFFMTLGALCGGRAGAVLAAWIFKAASTLDSTVGYDDEKYRDFGRASARLDDLLNFIPARLGSLTVLAAGTCLGYSFSQGFKIFLRDRKKHLSPNSGHGESAFAGLLGIRLGGGAFYGGEFEERPVIGDADFREPEAADILKAYGILDASVALSALAVYFFLR
ncbi:MAG: adenosylcobinamide-phosphate synthase CbiB [Synergistaceae bacterium]|jgi:adenosylcobinamide-phosphate synthase|nr:adenosylcobinamide-phosphate synthase CbiB [Synergistaceae bacterium]